MNDLISQLADITPAGYGEIISSGWIFLVALCAFLAKHIKRPPPHSNWLPLYTLINIIGQNTRRAANADDILDNQGQKNQ